ncbi:hypothetical protein [Bradyrhizobium sp. S69]|uniref:hypothetical protein n=1 Tax=Bradyrhizobium sp. S69 TaxID=1641856 RepID=UPI00131E06C0|nr:hypothetical protein [Bradyrhizobium sp. S69]
MTATITVGRRLVPIEHIALLEPFDPINQSRMQSDRPFQTRILLLNRDSILSEEPLDALTTQCRFRAAKEDGIATNPSVLFSVEAFEPAGEFKPTKAYRTRLLWRDQTGYAQSKLLLMTPEDALAIIVRGTEASPAFRKAKPSARRSRAKTTSPAPP